MAMYRKWRVKMQFHKVAEIFPMMGAPEYAALRDDVAKYGLREPIWLHEGQIIDGRNRYKACCELNITPEYRTWDGTGSLIAFVVSLNLHRRHLDESQRAMVGARIKPMFEEEARERQGARTDISANLRESLTPAKSSERAAEVVNVSPRSIESASKVIEKGASELVDAVWSGRASVSAAAEVATLPQAKQAEIVAKGESEILKAAKEIRAKKTEQRRQERIERITEISNASVEPLTGMGRFPIILADPPWRYDFSKDDADEIENHYPTMSLEEICCMGVGNNATDDCVLFLWATSPKLEEAFQVIRAWGFEYRTCAIWDKQWIGPGYYFRQRHELLLVAIRGAVPVPSPSNRPDSIFSAKRTAHSRKPDIAYELIETMYPDLPKLEMFCRSPRKGWKAWGNQVKEEVA